MADKSFNKFVRQDPDIEFLTEALATGYNAEVVNMHRRALLKTATIAISQSLSGVVDLEGCGLLGIIIPTALTAASLSFKASSATDGTFYDVKDDAGTAVGALATGSIAIGCDVIGPKLAPYRFIKIGTSAAQSAAVTFTLVLKT